MFLKHTPKIKENNNKKRCRISDESDVTQSNAVIKIRNLRTCKASTVHIDRLNILPELV